MAVDIVLDIGLPVMVVVLMLGMGAAIRLPDIQKATRQPKGILCGVLSQFFVMPCLALALAFAFNLSKPFALSLLIVGSCPGGTTSNLFTFWANGDLALSITMTCISTTLAMGMQPLILYVGAQIIDPSNTLRVDYKSLSLTLLGVTIPVGIGITVNRFSRKYGQWLTRAGSITGIVVVFVAIIYGTATQKQLLMSSPAVWACSILLGLAGFTFGYTGSFLFGLNRRQSRTVALETGIQNGPLAIAIVKISVGDDPEMLTFPLFYSVWIVFESIIVALAMRHIPVNKPPNMAVIADQVHRIHTEEGIVYRSLVVKGGELQTSIDPGVDTCVGVFQRSVAAYPRRRFLGSRQRKAGKLGSYIFKSYAEIDAEALAFGHGLRELGVEGGNFVGLISANREEWVVADLACQAFGFPTVPLYDTLGPDAVEFIVNKTRAIAIVCSRDHTASMTTLHQSCPSLQFVIQMDQLADEGSAALPSSTVRVMHFRDVLQSGLGITERPAPPTAEDVMTVCFTSGTTGTPKGVVLTHRNMVAAVAGAHSSLTGGIAQEVEIFGQGDSHLSYLPLAHMFERIIVQMMIWFGSAIGFYGGDVQKLLDDAVELEPTLFVSVPRLLNRVYDRIMTKVESQTTWVDCAAWPPFPRLSRWLFNKGLASKRNLLRTKNRAEDGFWDSVVFSNIAQRLGGRVRVVVTGSAPMEPSRMEFLRLVFSCHVLEGYGQTETTAVTHITLPGDVSVGHVGVPISSVEVKLIDVPELGFMTSENPPRGEVCFRGANVFSRYLGEEELSKQSRDEDGWLHSGDVGRVNPNGTLTIVDRVKNVFKLSQGEYVAPEKIEVIYVQSRFIQQVWVYGDSLQHHLVAIVVVEPFALKALKGATRGIRPGAVRRPTNSSAGGASAGTGTVSLAATSATEGSDVEIEDSLDFEEEDTMHRSVDSSAGVTRTPDGVHLSVKFPTTTPQTPGPFNAVSPKSRHMDSVDSPRSCDLNAASERRLLSPLATDLEQGVRYAAPPDECDDPEVMELCALEEVRELVLKDMAAIAKEQGLKGFEQAKVIHLTGAPFTHENGLLTPTFKLRRHEMIARFRHIVDELYREYAMR